MTEIKIEHQGRTCTGHYVIEGKRKLSFKVFYQDQEATDGHVYRPDQTGYIEVMAKQILREIVTGRLEMRNK